MKDTFDFDNLMISESFEDDAEFIPLLSQDDEEQINAEETPEELRRGGPPNPDPKQRVELLWASSGLEMVSRAAASRLRMYTSFCFSKAPVQFPKNRMPGQC